MPISFMRGAKRLRWREADRLLALALRIHEDMTCSGCGQAVSESMDPATADYWTTAEPMRCYACTALAVAHKQAEDREHPHALRHIVGMRPGGQEALAASRRESTPANQ